MHEGIDFNLCPLSFSITKDLNCLSSFSCHNCGIPEGGGVTLCSAGLHPVLPRGHSGSQRVRQTVSGATCQTESQPTETAAAAGRPHLIKLLSPQYRVINMAVALSVSIALTLFLWIFMTNLTLPNWELVLNSELSPTAATGESGETCKICQCKNYTFSGGNEQQQTRLLSTFDQSLCLYLNM